MAYVCSNCGCRRGTRFIVCENCGGMTLIFYPATYRLWSLKSLLRNWKRQYKKELGRASCLSKLVVENGLRKIC